MSLRFLARSLSAPHAGPVRIGNLSATRVLLPAMATHWHHQIRSITNTAAQASNNIQEATTIVSTRIDADNLHVKWQPLATATTVNESNYSYVWLRDNCQCGQCVHPSNRQKLHSTADVPLDIQPVSVTLKDSVAEVVWNMPLRHQQQGEQHVSQYPIEWLQRYASRENSEFYRFNHIQHRTWEAQDYKLKWISYDDYMNTDQGLHQVVQRLYNSGLVFLDNVPLNDDSVTKVAERIGPVQETFYGRDFDVKSIANSRNIAYTSLYLGFHMDLMYLDCPPGIQLLHSLKNSVTGGSSIFVDSYHAAKILKEQHPEDYEILTKTPVTFHYVNDGHHMYYRRPTIVVGEDESSGPAWNMHVNYAPPFQGPMDHLSAKDAKRFYQAFQRFADVVEDPNLRYELTLQPGQLVLFANRRVLHGRTEFDPTSGDRHLKGTYLTLDSLKDKLRVLCEKYGFDSSV